MHITLSLNIRGFLTNLVFFLKYDHRCDNCLLEINSLVECVVQFFFQGIMSFMWITAQNIPTLVDCYFKRFE